MSHSRSVWPRTEMSSLFSLPIRTSIQADMYVHNSWTRLTDTTDSTIANHGRLYTHTHIYIYTCTYACTRLTRLSKGGHVAKFHMICDTDRNLSQNATHNLAWSRLRKAYVCMFMYVCVCMLSIQHTYAPMYFYVIEIFLRMRIHTYIHAHTHRDRQTDAWSCLVCVTRKLSKMAHFVFKCNKEDYFSMFVSQERVLGRPACERVCVCVYVCVYICVHAK